MIYFQPPECNWMIADLQINLFLFTAICVINLSHYEAISRP